MTETKIELKIDTSLTGKPVQYLYWVFITLALIGVAWPIGANLYFESHELTDEQMNQLPDYLDMNNAVGGGVIMASVFGGIGGAFLIRCTSARKWKHEKELNPCRSFQENGRHSYDLTNVDLQYTTLKDTYGKVYHKFDSDPVKCETCDVTRKVSMSETMEDSIY